MLYINCRVVNCCRRGSINFSRKIIYIKHHWYSYLKLILHAIVTNLFSWRCFLYSNSVVQIRGPDNRPYNLELETINKLVSQFPGAWVHRVVRTTPFMVTGTSFGSQTGFLSNNQYTVKPCYYVFRKFWAVKVGTKFCIMNSLQFRSFPYLTACVRLGIKI
jgi:hypothetical protein